MVAPQSELERDAEALFQGPGLEALREQQRRLDARARRRAASIASEDQQWPRAEWLLALFTPEEKEAWMAEGGLMEKEYRVAQRARDAGFVPRQLKFDIKGQTVGSRLARGQDPGMVLRMLQRLNRQTGT